MKKIIVLGLFLVSILILSGCEGLDVSKLSDDDLDRVSDKLIKCESPYIRVGTECCVDQDDNKICDKDDAELEQLNVEPTNKKESIVEVEKQEAPEEITEEVVQQPEIDVEIIDVSATISGKHPSAKIDEVYYKIENRRDLFNARVDILWYDESSSDEVRNHIRKSESYVVPAEYTFHARIKDFESRYLSAGNLEEDLVVNIYNDNTGELLYTFINTLVPEENSADAIFSSEDVIFRGKSGFDVAEVTIYAGTITILVDDENPSARYSFVVIETEERISNLKDLETAEFTFNEVGSYTIMSVPLMKELIVNIV